MLTRGAEKPLHCNGRDVPCPLVHPKCDVTRVRITAVAGKKVDLANPLMAVAS